MAVFILGFIVIVLGFIGMVICRAIRKGPNFRQTNRFDSIDGVFTGCFIGGILGLAIILLTLIGRTERFNQFIYEYESTKALVESYQGYDYGQSYPLTQKIIDINAEIAKNKAWRENKWHDLWASEEIANLEPLKYKQLNEAY